jgi:hypothetical protein
MSPDFRNGNILYIKAWANAIRARISNPNIGTYFILGDQIFDSYQGKEATTIPYSSLSEIKYVKGNNAFLRLEPNASSSTNSVQSGRNLGKISAMKYVNSERKLYMYVPGNYENKLYKWIWSGFIA